ncbi:MAG: ABC transporter permease [Proteobacteria bacterium]|nr:ABC transporter permease [Pseudomonadota bacterium]
MLGPTLVLALREIRRHVLRSFLTVLGIVIGVAAVVTMVTLGNGATAAVREQISGLGVNILQIRPGQGFGRGGGGPAPADFDMDDVAAIRDQVAGVVVVAPLSQSSGTAVRNAANWSTTVNGTTSDYFTAQQWETASDPAYDMAAVTASIQSLLRERRNIRGAKQDDFNIFDTAQIPQTLQGTTRILTSLLGAVAAVSLLVGGIGIMNIMLVSVTERTREIGIRLAIGAVGREVLLQFLVEATVLACLGGVVGLLLALVASWALAPMLQVPFLFDVRINAVAFVFSALIGVIFGYFPARQAAQLNPIDALRHE